MTSDPLPAPCSPATRTFRRPRSERDLSPVDGTEQIPAGRGCALVLHGGGSAGNAWEIGVIAGLFDTGVDVTEADLIIGTSAGATATAQITWAAPTELLAGILDVPSPSSSPGDPSGPSVRRPPIGPAADHMERTTEIIAAARDAADMRRRIGRGRARKGCGRRWCRTSGVAGHRRRPTSQSSMAGTSDPHHGGRCAHWRAGRLRPAQRSRSGRRRRRQHRQWLRCPSVRHRRRPVHRRRLSTKRKCRSGGRIRAGTRPVALRRQIAASRRMAHATRRSGGRAPLRGQQRRDDRSRQLLP